MDSSLAEPQQYVDEADGLLGGCCRPTEEKCERAATLYAKGAGLYKHRKQTDVASELYLKSARLFLRIKDDFEAANNFREAAFCLNKCGRFKESVLNYRLAVQSYEANGRFVLAGKYQLELADVEERRYRGQSGDDGAGSSSTPPHVGVTVSVDQLLDDYELAANYYRSVENSTSQINEIQHKVGLLAAESGKYEKAIEIFERLASESVDNSSLRWSVPDYLLKAGLCHLCNEDLPACQKALQQYKETYGAFESSKECRLLQILVDVYEHADVELFVSALEQYPGDLDNWKTNMLSKVKTKLQSLA